MNAPHVVCGAFSCLSTAALEATGGGATKVGPVGLCLLVLHLLVLPSLILRLSDVLCPLVLRVEGLRVLLPGLLCPVCMNCRKLYRMVL